MEKYYLVGMKFSPKTGVATQLTQGQMDADSFLEKVSGLDRFPYEFTLCGGKPNKNGEYTPLTYTEEENWHDEQPNDLTLPLWSHKMREVVEPLLSEVDCLRWMEADVVSPSERRTYHIPVFTKKPDVLDLKLTRFVPGTRLVVMPAFSRLKLSRRNIFCVPRPGNAWKMPSGIYVSGKIKDALEKSTVKGIKFEEVRRVF